MTEPAASPADATMPRDRLDFLENRHTGFQRRAQMMVARARKMPDKAHIEPAAPGS